MSNDSSSISTLDIIMKTSLPLESKPHQERIQAITDIIVATAKDKIAFVILFGPFARGDWILEDYPGVNLTSVTFRKIASNYHLLIVTKAKRYGAKNSANRLRKRITDEINKKIKDKTHPTHLMIEPIDYINCETNQKRYFFADVKKEGILLYSSKGFKLSKNFSMDLKARIQTARVNYCHLMSKAKEFIKYCHLGIANNDFQAAAFNLHQATEFLYNCILLVSNGYEARTHDLKKLNKLCAANSNQFLTIFPTILSQERLSFFLLRKAYNKSRYDEGYKINKEQLEYLNSRVEKLMKIAITNFKDVIGECSQDEIAITDLFLHQ